MLDFANMPGPFKVYKDLSPIPLPRDFPRPMLGARSAIQELEPTGKPDKFDVGTLAEILFFSGGLTRVLKYSHGTFYMRAASATGALYPIELYVISQDIPGLKAGVYHFNPLEFALTPIRHGDYRNELAASSGENSSITAAPVTIAFTSFAWRNAWKYQGRSYRHWFWDSGVIAANLLATTVSTKVKTEIILGFQDVIVDSLLCLNEKVEATVALAPLGIGISKPSETGVKDIPVINLSVLPLSREEVQYPEVWEMNGASVLTNHEEVKRWVHANGTIKERSGKVRTASRTIKPSSNTSKESPLDKVILKRGSTRRFANKAVSFEQLSNVLLDSSRGVPLDCLNKPGETMMKSYLIANAVEGLSSGAYYYDRSENSLLLLKEGEFRSDSGSLCLGQPLFSRASIVFFLMTDLEAVLDKYGNRGYRAAQFEAGVTAGKIYLSAYAQGLGASGSTFYDDAVTQFFSPHAKFSNAMIAVGVGVPDYRARPGEVLVGKLSA